MNILSQKRTGLRNQFGDWRYRETGRIRTGGTRYTYHGVQVRFYIHTVSLNETSSEQAERTLTDSVYSMRVFVCTSHFTCSVNVFRVTEPEFLTYFRPPLARCLHSCSEPPPTLPLSLSLLSRSFRCTFLLAFPFD